MIRFQGAATYKHRVRLQHPDGCEAYIDKGYKEGAGTALDFTPSRAFKDINGQAYEGPLHVPNPPTTGLGGPIERVAPQYVSSALPPNVYRGENLVLFGSTLSNFTLYMLVEFIQAIIKSGQIKAHVNSHKKPQEAKIIKDIATIVTVGNSLQESCNAVIHYPEHVHYTWIEANVLPDTKDAYVLPDAVQYRNYYDDIINQRAKSVVVCKDGEKLWMDPVIDADANTNAKNAQLVAAYIVKLVQASNADTYIKVMISVYCHNLFKRIQKEVTISTNDAGIVSWKDRVIVRCNARSKALKYPVDKKPHKHALKETESERKSAEDQKTYQRKKSAFLEHVAIILGDLKGRVDMRMRDTLMVYLCDLLKFLGMDQTDMLNELGWESPKVPKPSTYATHFNSIYETESTSPMVNLTYNCRFVTFYKRALTLCTIFKKTTGRGQIMHILLRHEMDLLKWPDNPSSNDAMSLALHLAINDTSSTPLWPNLQSNLLEIGYSFIALYGNGARVNEAMLELMYPCRADTETNVYSRKAPTIQACLDIVEKCTTSEQVDAAMLAQYAPVLHKKAILKKHRTIVTTEGNILLDLACDRATYFRLTTLAPLGEDYSPFKMGLLRNAAPIKHPPFMLRFYGTSRDYEQNDEQELAPDKIYVNMLHAINGTRTVIEHPELIKPIFMWCQLVYGFMRLRMDDYTNLVAQYSGIRIIRNETIETDVILEYTPEDNKVRIARKEAEEKVNREAQKDFQIQRREALITFATDNIEEYNDLTLCEDALMEKSSNENMHVPVLAFLYHMVTHRPFAHCEKIDTSIGIFSFNARALPIAMYFLEYFNDKDVIADMADIIFLANNDKVKAVFIDICPYAWPQQQFAISTDEISYNGDVPWSHARNSVFSRCLETLRQKDFACIPIAKDPERRYMHFTRFLNISPGEVNVVQSHYETDDDNEVEEETEKVKHSKGHKRGNDPIDDEAGEVEEVARPLFYLQGPMVEVKTEAKEVDDSGDGEEEASDEDEGEEEEEEAVDSGEEEESDEEEEGDEEASDTD